MKLTFKIAWRNLWRHKGKSMTVGVILFIGALIMTVGNGMISGLEKGFSENIVNLFTGDIVIISDEQDRDDVLYEFTGKPLSGIKNYDALRELLKADKNIQSFLPATIGTVMVLDPNSEMEDMVLLGVDIAEYQKVFPDSFQVIKGDILYPGETGLLLSDYTRQACFENMGFWLLPENSELDPEELPAYAHNSIDNLDLRSDIVFMGASYSNTMMDVRVPVKGIIKYKSLNKLWGRYSIVDIESFRQAHNYITGADSMVELSQEEEELLSYEEFDQLFGLEDIIDQSMVTDQTLSIQDIRMKTEKSEKEYSTDKGSYNVVLVKLKRGSFPIDVLENLNTIFKENQISARAISWKQAMGPFGSMAVMIKAALNIFIMNIFFIAIIIIMNTLIMAALERVPEIGTMRAIGARKGFVRRMFVCETGLLSFFFGGLGILAGIIVIYLLKSMNISTTNEFLQLVYGGDILNPLFNFSDLLIGILELGIVTILAVLYPLKVVGRIVPLDAIARD